MLFTNEIVSSLFAVIMMTGGVLMSAMAVCMTLHDRWRGRDASSLTTNAADAETL